MNAEDYEAEIERLLNAKPETGEQWAEVARLETLMIKARQAERNVQVAEPLRVIINSFSAHR